MNSDPAFTKTCTHFLARTAMNAAEAMTTDERIMIQQGIVELFPQDSEEHIEAKKLLETLTKLKSLQLSLFNSLRS